MGKYQSAWGKAPRQTKESYSTVDYLSIDGLTFDQINKLSVQEYQERANQLQSAKRKTK